MILYELRKNSVIYFRPTFRLKTHINPILKNARTVRIIKKRSNVKHPPISLIPKRPSNSLAKPKVKKVI